MRTPKTIPQLLPLARRAFDGARALDNELKQNTAEAIAADLAALAGRRATDSTTAVPGWQAAYLEARAEHAAARATHRAAVETGRVYCAKAVDFLKLTLGRQWNTQWHAAGFNAGSIAIPRDPLPVLPLLSAYFRSVPERENAQAGITASATDELVRAIDQTRQVVDAKRTLEAEAKQWRDAAVQKLRARLTALRHELALLLP